MDLDLLNGSYPMDKSKFPFKDFGQAGLTGLVGRSNRVCPGLPILGVNICPLFYYKACVLKTILRLM
jgi:hypothetical protein